ncbi:MAG: PilZ domain-containing protein [Bryobacteraceae bacterium]
MRSLAGALMEATGYRAAFDRMDLIERRSKLRFPFELRVSFRTLGQICPVAGMGRVLNISSIGVLIACQHEVSAGTPVEVKIDWPTRLDGRIPLQLVANGTVVRCELFSFAVGLERYHFGIAGRTDLPDDEPFEKAAEA